MKTLNNIKDFLYCKDYFINVFENNIHVFNFKNLISISDNVLEFEFNNFELTITGENFIVKKMYKNEMLIQGKIYKLEYKNYE